MKKFYITLMSFATACLLLVSASSCTHEYTCQCEISYSGVPGLPQPDNREYSITDTKDNAKSICESNSKTYMKNGITTVEKCNLK